MPFDFLTPRIERLGADGSIQVLHPGSYLGRLLRSPVLLLSRDLCSFSLFDATALPRSKRLQAARLHARTSAPYLRSNWTLTKAQDTQGIWWWNEDKVASLLPAVVADTRPVILPETLLQAPPHNPDYSWRIVRLAHGFESQLWRGKALVASAWRRERYDKASWSAFVRLQRTQTAAPDLPPAPADLPIAYDPRLVHRPLELSREKLALLVGAGAVMACLSLASFMAGQAWQIDKDTQQARLETAQIRARTPKATATQDLYTNQKLLVAYQEIDARTNPLSAAGAAIGILAFHEVTPISVKTENDSLNFVLSYGFMDKVPDLAEDLRTSGYFYDIRPRTERANRQITFEMKVREAAPPLGSDTP